MKKHGIGFYLRLFISLVVLSILVYYFTFSYLRKNNLTPIVFMDNIEAVQIQNDTNSLFNRIFSKKVKQIHLQGNEKEDENTLKVFSSKLNEMIQSGDTNQGVHLVFPVDVSKTLFNKSIEICRENVNVTYALYENNLWAFYNKFDSSKLAKFKEAREKIKDEKHYRQMQKYIYKMPFSHRFNQTAKVWPIFLAMFLMIFISVKKTK